MVSYAKFLSRQLSTASTALSKLPARLHFAQFRYATLNFYSHSGRDAENTRTILGQVACTKLRPYVVRKPPSL